jgi:hypothetical protein
MRLIAVRDVHSLQGGRAVRVSGRTRQARAALEQVLRDVRDPGRLARGHRGEARARGPAGLLGTGIVQPSVRAVRRLGEAPGVPAGGGDRLASAAGQGHYVLCPPHPRRVNTDNYPSFCSFTRFSPTHTDSDTDGVILILRVNQHINPQIRNPPHTVPNRTPVVVVRRATAT